MENRGLEGIKDVGLSLQGSGFISRKIQESDTHLAIVTVNLAGKNYTSRHKLTAITAIITVLRILAIISCTES